MLSAKVARSSSSQAIEAAELERLRQQIAELKAEVADLRATRSQSEVADADFLRSVLASSNDCIKVLDLDANLIFMSEGGQRVMEVNDFNAIKGCPWPDFWQGEGSEIARAAVETAKAGGTAHFQGPANTMAGTPRWWDVQVTPIRGADGAPEKLLSVSRDITERKLAEEALRLRSDEFYTLADNIPTLAWIAHADGHIHWYNRRWYEYTGTTPESQAGWGWQSVHDPETLPCVIERWTNSIATGQPFEMTFPLKGHDGVFRPFLTRIVPVRDEKGDILRWVGTNVDISEQQAIEEELKRRVAESLRERDLVWNISQDLFVICGFDGFYRSLNPAWQEKLGYGPDELVGTRFDALVHPEDVAVSVQGFNRILTEGLVRDIDLRVRAKDGSFRWYSWACIAEGEAFYAAGRDITDRRELEEQLRQAQKMEAVGQLTGGIAHDFNNLLTGIVGSLDMMQTRLSQGRMENIERYLKAAMSSAHRAAALTHRLLAFARRQPLDPKAVRANDLVVSLEDLLRRTIGEAISLEITTSGGLWPSLCDPHQLESAILNLAINARDAMPDGGKLHIETCNTHLDADYAKHHHGVEPGQYICISVTDTGAGMPPEVIARAFDPFFTTKPLGQGTGLGLSMIYGFAQQSNGHVKIYSEVGVGTTVKLYLPRYVGEVIEEISAEGLNDHHRATTGETVLVAEDESVVRDLIVEVLSNLGYHALEAQDGPSGLKVLQSSERIDLLVTDVGLPGLNGRQLADQARETRPDLKVLFITGYAENAMLRNGHLDPGMQMLTKPFSVDMLATRIREIIEV